MNNKGNRVTPRIGNNRKVADPVLKKVRAKIAAKSRGANRM